MRAEPCPSQLMPATDSPLSPSSPYQTCYPEAYKYRCRIFYGVEMAAVVIKVSKVLQDMSQREMARRLSTESIQDEDWFGVPKASRQKEQGTSEAGRRNKETQKQSLRPGSP